MQFKLSTFLIFQIDISGKLDNDEHPLNKYFIFLNHIIDETLLYSLF